MEDDDETKHFFYSGRLGAQRCLRDRFREGRASQSPKMSTSSEAFQMKKEESSTYLSCLHGYKAHVRENLNPKIGENKVQYRIVPAF